MRHWFIKSWAQHTRHYAAGWARYHVTCTGDAGPRNIKLTEEFDKKIFVFVQYLYFIRAHFRDSDIPAKYFEFLFWGRETNNLLSYLRTNIKSISNLTKINIGSALIFEEILGI